MATHDRRRETRDREEPAPAIRRAAARLAGGQPDSALKTIDEHLALHPDDSPALFVRSRILHELGDRPAALECRLRALRSRGAHEDAAAIADLLVEDGLEGEAESFLLARLAARPKLYTARFVLARIYLLAGRYVAAEREIRTLYDQVGRGGPIVRADYLEALRLALLGDHAALVRHVDRLRRNGVAGPRLTWFVALQVFLESGDADAFAAAMARLVRLFRREAHLHALFRRVTPELFQGCEGRKRIDFQRVLGESLRGPRIAGIQLPADQLAVVRDLFHRYSSVRIEAIDSPDSGYSGDRVYRVFTAHPHHAEYSCLLKLGPKHRIAIEKEKIAELVLGKLHPGFHPQVVGYASGFHAAALRLTWAAAGDEIPRSLRSMYADPSTGSVAIAGLVAPLYETVLAGWHERNAAPAQRPLLEKPERLRTWIATARVARTGQAAPGRLRLASLGEEITDPDALIARLRTATARERHPEPWGLRHGDLNGRNILLDAGDHLCLVDFYKAGVGAVLHDFARLEVDLRFEALPGEPEHVAELRAMDAALARVVRAPSLRNLDIRRSLEKRLAVALAIRDLAWQRMEPLTERVRRRLYAARLLETLCRVVTYGHLSPTVTDLALSEIADLAGLLLE